MEQKLKGLNKEKTMLRRFEVLDSLDLAQEILFKCLKEKEISFPLCDKVIGCLDKARGEIMDSIHRDKAEEDSNKEGGTKLINPGE